MIILSSLLLIGMLVKLTANVPMLYEGGEIDAHPVSLAQMTNSSTIVQLRNAAPLLYSICWQQYLIIYQWQNLQN